MPRLNRLLQEAGVTRAAWDSRGRWQPSDLPAMLAAFDGGASALALSKQHGVARHVISRVLRENGRAPRTRSQAEVTKWAQMGESARQAQVGAAHAACLGSKRNQAWLAAQAAAKQRLGHWVSPKERRLAGWLAERGMLVTDQLPIRQYNADLACYPLTVEIHSASYLQPGKPAQVKRVFDFLDAGWSMLVVVDYGVPVAPSCADYAVAFLQELRSNPPSLREYRVVDGAGQLRAAYRLNGDRLTVVFSARGRAHIDREYLRPR